MAVNKKLFGELTKVAYGMEDGPEKSKLLRVLVHARQKQRDAVTLGGIRDRLVRLAHDSDPSTRARLLPLVKKVVALAQPLTLQPDYGSREAKGWSKLPKGWTQESVKKFWEDLTGERKHKVTACIKKMTGKVDDPGAFCASLADMMEPGWRSDRSGSVLPKGAKITGFDYQGDRAEFYFDSNQTIVVNVPEGRVAALVDLTPQPGDVVASSKEVDGALKVQFESGKSLLAKKKDDKKGESDIEPTHARKEWPELPPGTKSAKQFPTDEALKQYLKEHPKADPSKHSVGKPSGKGKSKKSPSKSAPAGKPTKAQKDLKKDEDTLADLKETAKKLPTEHVKKLIKKYEQSISRRKKTMDRKREKAQKNVDEFLGHWKDYAEDEIPPRAKAFIDKHRREVEKNKYASNGLSAGDKVVVTNAFRGPGGNLNAGDTATVTGTNAGPNHDMFMLALDGFSESMPLTEGIVAPGNVLKKQACGDGPCQCGGSCGCAKNHIREFISDNPDLAVKLAGLLT